MGALLGVLPVRGLAGLAVSATVTGLFAGAASAQNTLPLSAIDVISSRIGRGITGTSTSVITAEEIARSPSHSLQDILSREPGVQVTNLFGGVNGARSVVDMRGFGATAGSNTLILINGRRLNDLDIAAVDLAAIPRDSIERVEITRGNSGAVLYGDGAVGGVINIVTKSSVTVPPWARVEGGRVALAFLADRYVDRDREFGLLVVAVERRIHATGSAGLVAAPTSPGR